VSEAYVQASAPPPELRRIAAATTAIAFVYGGAALAGVRLLRTSGLVLANVLNLGLRTALSYRYIGRAAAARAPGAPLRLAPAPAVLAAFALSAAATNATALWLGAPDSLSPSSHAAHVVVGVACLGGVVAAVVAGEPELAGALLGAVRRRHGRED